MKKAHYKTDKGFKSKPPANKQTNMRVSLGDHENNTAFAISESECLMDSQVEYIENLQQQIFVLENEINYLRSNFQDSTKQYPSVIAESERMVKKLADCNMEIKNLKIELKRKETAIDMLYSEKNRIQKRMERLEETFKQEKCSLLEDLIATQKDKDVLQATNIDNEKLLEEQIQNSKRMQEDIDNYQVETQQYEREKSTFEGTLNELKVTKDKLQKDFIEACMKLDAKCSQEGEETIKSLKEEISRLIVTAESATRALDHERMLRERLSQENTEYIQRHSALEADLAEVRARHREEQGLRTSLEAVHLKIVLEASEFKNNEKNFKDQIEHLNKLLKEECDRSHELAKLVAEEQRSNAHVEEKLLQQHQKYKQREDQFKGLKNENINVLRDNSYLKDQVMNLKQEVQTKEDEMINMKSKAQEMQVSAEEFVQNSELASRLTGERFKQLQQLAQSIQALTCIEDGH